MFFSWSLAGRHRHSAAFLHSLFRTHLPLSPFLSPALLSCLPAFSFLLIVLFSFPPNSFLLLGNGNGHRASSFMPPAGSGCKCSAASAPLLSLVTWLRILETQQMMTFQHFRYSLVYLECPSYGSGTKIPLLLLTLSPACQRVPAAEPADTMSVQRTPLPAGRPLAPINPQADASGVNPVNTSAPGFTPSDKTETPSNTSRTTSPSTSEDDGTTQRLAPTKERACQANCY